MPKSPLAPLPAASFDYWHAQHLLNRAGFGGTPAQVRALANLGLDAAVDYIIDFDKTSAPLVLANTFDKDIVRPANAEERREIQEARRRGDEAALERFRMEVQRRQQADRQQMRRLQLWWLQRLIETPRPLEEKLTLFWHGHFATSYRSVEDSYNLYLQNQFFRANAAGSFADLLLGIIRDPAMLAYLDNNQNYRARPNENLARELMELFTLGEGRGYSESDIKNGARALTGYTFDDNEFFFNPNNHDSSEKTIFGKSGSFNGEDFCKLILAKPACSEYLCLKLYRFFVNDLPALTAKPAQEFILALAQVLRDHNYALRPVLKMLFRADHFYLDNNLAALVKSPLQLIVQTIRSLLTPVRSLDALASAADFMGQNLFFPPSVKGWDAGRAWINTSTLFVRQNFVVFLLTGRRPDQYEWQSDDKQYSALHLVQHLQPTASSLPPADYASSVISYLLRFTLGVQPHPDRLAQLTAYIQSQQYRIDNQTLVALLALIAAMPEFQLC